MLGVNKTIQEFIWKYKGKQMAKILLRKKKVRGLIPIQNYSEYSSVVLLQGETNRTMGRTIELKDRHRYLQSLNLLLNWHFISVQKRSIFKYMILLQLNSHIGGKMKLSTSLQKIINVKAINQKAFRKEHELFLISRQKKISKGLITGKDFIISKPRTSTKKNNKQ